MDPEGLDEESTSTSPTNGHNFREKVIQRDGSCVITKKPAEYCDVAHLIPRAKGNEVNTYILIIILYNSLI